MQLDKHLERKVIKMALMYKMTLLINGSAKG